MSGSNNDMESDAPKSCCTPARGSTKPDELSAHLDAQMQSEHPATPPASSASARHQTAPKHPAGLRIPAGAYLLGDAFSEGYSHDGEGPQHTVELTEFMIDAHPVTNAEFAAFVADTGYVTDAERYGTSAVFHLALDARREDVLGAAPSAPWWLEVRGADWRHPYGLSGAAVDLAHDTAGLANHPVVHVSWFDAMAWCEWAGRALPSEAQWEAAARGGLVGARYAWGDELMPDGEHRCNIWQGSFPRNNTGADGWMATSPVDSYPPNGFGLSDVAGNVWEWCADWFELDAYAARLAGRSPMPDAEAAPDSRRVTRGGSYLCHDSYCNRYRVAARTGNTPDSSSGNMGFRSVAR